MLLSPLPNVDHFSPARVSSMFLATLCLQPTSSIQLLISEDRSSNLVRAMATRKRRRADTIDTADTTNTADTAPRQAFGPTEARSALLGNHFTGNTNIHFGGGIDEEQKAKAEKAEKAEKDACLRSLAFGEIHARRHDIAVAHPETCDWLFQTTEFHQWRDPNYRHTHHGVLWIKGNPGVGKSTLMKHAYSHFKNHMFSDHLIAAYFFNARGTTLEKTLLGLLRSIVHQLLQDDKLYNRFISLLREKQMTAYEGGWQWRLSELQGFVHSVIIQPSDLRPLFILLDALDECDESDVRNIVRFLELLSIQSYRGGHPLRICLSSRHYPSIHMKTVVELQVEGMPGHREDIAKYITERILETDTVIEAEIINRANGIFLWVVIVVSILNKAYDEGRVEAIQKTLDELPEDLDNLFTSILKNADAIETLRILQWVLLSERPLQLKELFAAVFQRDALPRTDIMMRRITTLSKGLVEVRKGKPDELDGRDTVQFIHLSVNDFLCRRKILSRIDPSLAPEPIISSHGQLWARCWAAIEPAATTAIDEESFYRARNNDPFLEYAATNVLYHAERAFSSGVTRAERDVENASELSSTSHQLLIKQWLQKADRWFRWWTMFLSITSSGEKLRFPGELGTGPVYVSVLLRLPNLLRTSLAAGADINAQGGRYVNALHAALQTGNKDTVQLLLNAGADANMQIGFYSNALQAALQTDNKDIVQLLLNAGVDVNAQGGKYGNALQAASRKGRKGRKDNVQLLLDAGADVNAQGGFYGNALQAACVIRGDQKVVQLLLDAGADVNAQGGYHGNALQAASWIGNKDTIQLLLEVGADVNAQGGHYGNALQAASWIGNKDTIQLLLDADADVNAQGGYYGNALQAVSYSGNKHTVQLLLDVGADVNAQGGRYGSALQAASQTGNKDIIQFLLEAGADPNE
ncbi:ankyrin repeat domain-containing protein 50 [Microdochium nivale]|nr:ankyrin repeat domain-containing protein 50 [Microdochium nivale]